MGSAVQLAGVCKRFAPGAPQALDHLTLEVAEGEFLFLLGPSGCGKTTALRLIGGYERPDAGVVALGGAVVNDVPAHQRNVGMVFQHYALFPHMTVAQNVAFGLRMRRVPSDERSRAVDWALNLVRLAGMGGRYPRELSGGQQQRVALARAIAFRPALLLLDEPFANLDRHLRDEMRLELKVLQRRLGLTTVFVTHDQEEALAMADRVAVLDRGRLQQAGAPSALYNRPQTGFVARFMGEMNLLDGILGGPTPGEDGLTSAADAAGLPAGGLPAAPGLSPAGATGRASHPASVTGLRLATIAGVRLPVYPPAEAHRGDAVEVCLRAERLCLQPLYRSLEGGRQTAGPSSAAVEAGTSGWPGTVRLVTYLGASTHYVVELDAGPTLRVVAPNADDAPAWQADDRARVVWTGGVAHCLRETASL